MTMPENQDVLTDKGITTLVLPPKFEAGDLPAARTNVNAWISFFQGQSNTEYQGIIAALIVMRDLITQEATQIGLPALKAAFEGLVKEMTAKKWMAENPEENQETEPGPTTPVNRPRRVSRLGMHLAMFSRV